MISTLLAASGWRTHPAAHKMHLLCITRWKIRFVVAFFQISHCFCLQKYRKLACSVTAGLCSDLQLEYSCCDSKVVFSVIGLSLPERITCIRSMSLCQSPQCAISGHAEHQCTNSAGEVMMAPALWLFEFLSVFQWCLSACKAAFADGAIEAAAGQSAAIQHTVMQPYGMSTVFKWFLHGSCACTRMPRGTEGRRWAHHRATLWSRRRQWSRFGRSAIYKLQ